MVDNEKIADPYKLLFTDGASLMSLASGKSGAIIPTKNPKDIYDPNKTAALAREWDSIYQLLVSLVGREKVIIARTGVVTGKKVFDGQSRIKWQYAYAPHSERIGAIDLPFLDPLYSSWPRDGFTVIGDHVYGNSHPKAWRYNDDCVQLSPLGEGGKVLTAGNRVVVSKDLWNSEKMTINKLQDEGFKVGWLPIVNPDRQKVNFNYEQRHIDGHAALVTTKEEETVLLAAQSYASQDRDTLANLRKTARDIGGKLHLVKDTHIPPLSLNFLQFRDHSVAMTSDAAELEEFLIELLGEDLVHTTTVPIANIPIVGAGSIRCLTNLLPDLPDSYWQVNPFSLTDSTV